MLPIACVIKILYLVVKFVPMIDLLLHQYHTSYIVALSYVLKHVNSPIIILLNKFIYYSPQPHQEHLHFYSFTYLFI